MRPHLQVLSSSCRSSELNQSSRCDTASQQTGVVPRLQWHFQLQMCAPDISNGIRENEGCASGQRTSVLVVSVSCCLYLCKYDHTESLFQQFSWCFMLCFCFCPLLVRRAAYQVRQTCYGPSCDGSRHEEAGLTVIVYYTPKPYYSNVAA